MKQIINGGIYSVNFNGQKACEFKGEHPTLIVRTLKENDIYIAIPLTSYTKERWEKCKSKGFGTRILSSNSIARIDKFKIINKDSIKNRWKSNNKILKITPDELKNTNEKLDKYLNLSSEKAIKEYNKYLAQYKSLFSEVHKISIGDTSSLVSKTTENGNTIFKIDKSNTTWLSKSDIKEIILDNYSCEKPIIDIHDNNVIIKF